MRMERKTLAIMAVYDPDGIVDDYIVYYLLSLKKVADRIIVVANGDLTGEGEDKLGGIADKIWIRENRGFDFGAYKEVICSCLEEVSGYQELILCNDTCFGPFIPFEDIFLKMDSENLDFWSMNYIDDRLLPHFQSYFMVFQKEAIPLLVDFLDREVDIEAGKVAQAHGYEHALSEVMLISGLKHGYYTSGARCRHDIDIYGAPDHAIKDLGLPMLKKKAFSEEYDNRENVREALRLIAEEGSYPIKHILEYVKRTYGKDCRLDLGSPVPTALSVFPRHPTTREDIIGFCRKHKKIYVYGNGYMSVLFLERFGRYMDEFGGYIVSDEYYTGSSWNGERVHPVSAMADDIPIIVALMEKSTRQIKDKLFHRQNVLFLSIRQNGEKEE